MPVTKKLTIDWRNGTLFWDGVLEADTLVYLKEGIADAQRTPEPWKVVPSYQITIELNLPMPLLDPSLPRQDLGREHFGRRVPRSEWAWQPINAATRNDDV